MVWCDMVTNNSCGYVAAHSLDGEVGGRHSTKLAAAIDARERELFPGEDVWVFSVVVPSYSSMFDSEATYHLLEDVCRRSEDLRWENTQMPGLNMPDIKQQNSLLSAISKTISSWEKSEGLAPNEIAYNFVCRYVLNISWQGIMTDVYLDSYNGSVFSSAWTIESESDYAKAMAKIAGVRSGGDVCSYVDELKDRMGAWNKTLPRSSLLIYEKRIAHLKFVLSSPDVHDRKLSSSEQELNWLLARVIPLQTVNYP